jgi:hypothetical protein
MVKNLINQFVLNLRTFGFRLALVALVVGAMSVQSQATAGAVETAITTAVGDAKTAGEAILAIAATVLGAFLIFKFCKRGASKA